MKKGHVRWRPDEARRLAAALSSGATFEEAARALGRTRASVQCYVRGHGGKEAVAAGGDVSGERIRELFEAGLPYGAIAKETGLTKAAVTGRCHAMGLFRTLEDGHRMRGAMKAYDEAHPRPRAGGPRLMEGDGPLVRRFNEQQERIWAEGGPKPVRYKDAYYDDLAVW